MKLSLMVGLLVGALGAQAGDVVRWETPRDISGDGDVVTEGRPVMAVNWSSADTVVNGVAFAHSTTTTGQGLLNTSWAHYLATDFSSRVADEFLKTGGGACSADYRRLLCGGIYDGKNAQGSYDRTLTLRNLVPGRTYLVQLWFNDVRTGVSDGGIHYTHFGASHQVLIDGAVTARYKISTDGAALGQHVVGRFTAPGPSVSILLSPQTIDLGQNPLAPPSAQLNAFQLRDVTSLGEMIAWGTPCTIGADADVSTEGISCLACHFRTSDADSYSVNGVAFTGSGTAANAAKVSFTVPNGSIGGKANVFADGATRPEEVSADYLSVIAGGVYADRAAEAVVTLSGLVPGRSYLVQVWLNDSRGNRGGGSNARMLVDDVPLLIASDGAPRLGQHVTGRFRARGTTKTFRLHHLATGIAGDISASLNAIQVRELPDTLAVESVSAKAAQGETDVATEGSGCYAFSYSSSEVIANGVTFSKGVAGAEPLAGKVTLTPALSLLAQNAFLPTPSVVSDAYGKLLGSAAYQDNATELSVTLKDLTPGRCYLAQFWMNDQRTQYGPTMTVAFPGCPETFPMRAADAPNLGPVGTFAFVADACEKTYSFTYDHTVAHRTIAAQLNALQLRDVGDGCWRWGGAGNWTAAGTGWVRNDDPVPEELWTPEAGATNVALVTTGTIRPTEDVTVARLLSVGPLVVGEPGDTVKLTVADEVVADSCTVHSVWGAEHVRKTRSGELVLTGACPSLVDVYVQTGRVTFATDLVKCAFVRVAKGAELAVVEGHEVSLSALVGEGCVTGAGTLALGPGGDQMLVCTFAGTPTLRHEGPMNVTLCVAQTVGGLSVEQADGAGAFDFGGLTHSLASIAGGSYRNGTLGGTLVVKTEARFAGVALEPGTRVTSLAPLHVEDAQDLANVTFAVPDPVSLKAQGGVVVSAAQGTTGEPVFEVANGFSVVGETTEDGARIWRLKKPGIVIIFR